MRDVAIQVAKCKHSEPDYNEKRIANLIYDSVSERLPESAQYSVPEEYNTRGACTVTAGPCRALAFAEPKTAKGTYPYA